MNLRPRREREPDINLTPLIDVVFLLLIFFMVSTTFERSSELAIELPEATTEPAQQEPEAIEVAIDASGRYYVNGTELINTQLSSVKQALSRAAGGRDDPPIVISADGRSPHQAVVTVMDAARQLGLVHLTFSTRVTEDDSP
ncbi:MAG: biopolymer transporter ExbD [Gammaproteobacteria bacterium]|nr:biopolymer transporter ExbD [Gammaproteobacteria bacterium]NIR85478.1 biopolymer transporter ExbD [Gammaproteobacteria bacterium]NIR89530.1 biopolymer transporter ExbD [Gammaproteobacteria bacterium]NIU06615.1 biopolymer transporter ExbD [Gammaproteobacteria bacterium]NIV53498.1 biopolymer transporter ExbD [Gammaproteobacteria bacterium]